MNDTQLKDLIPFFEKLATVENVYSVLKTTDKDSVEIQNPMSPIALQCTTSSADNNAEPIIMSSSPISNIPHPTTPKFNNQFGSA